MLEAISKRRSCRKFDSARMVEKEKIEEIVNAGLYAPSGMNFQTGIIIVIQDKKTRDALSKINAEIMNAPIDPFYGAPVIMLVAVKKSPNAVYDGSVMIENMLLEAENQGLSSIWIHRAKQELEREDVRELLQPTGLDLSEYEGIGHVAIGYSDIEYSERKIKPDRAYYIK